MAQWTQTRGSGGYWMNGAGRNINCGLSQSTLANIFKRNTVPSITTLEVICKGFGITLSQFFADGEMVEMTPELKEVFESWMALTPSQKSAALQMLKAMSQNE